MMTIWQPSYSPTWTPIERKRRAAPCKMQSTKEIILSYLDKHGITEKRAMMKALGMTNAKLRHGLAKLGSNVEYEISGVGGLRMCHYWSTSNPPTVKQRCTRYQVYDFFLKNPWSYANQIPDEIVAVPRHKHMIVMALEESGKLISRDFRKLKQYKAVHE